MLPYFVKWEGIHLDLCIQADIDKADVLVLHPGFHLQPILIRHDDHKRLRGGDNAPYGMNGELLDGSVYQGGQPLPLVGMGRLDQFLGHCFGAGFDFRQLGLNVFVEFGNGHPERTIHRSWFG